MVSLSDHFARVVVISLPAREDRRVRLRTRLSEGNIGGDITWVAACEGAALQPPPGWRAGTGAWGCLQSHLQVLRQAQQDGIASILILEDDVCFHPHTDRALPAFLRAVPADWGQIYLGGQHLEPARPTASPLVVIPSNVNRTHAYAVSREQLPLVITWLERMDDYTRQNWHVDHQLGAAHQRALWPVYAPTWWLAGQEESGSDVCGLSLRRRWWHPRRWALQLPFFTAPPDSAGDPDPNFFFGPDGASPPDLASCDESLLLSWLYTCARDSLDHGCLPAIKDLRPDVHHRIRHLWPAGLRPWSADMGPAPCAYPFDGLFPHPFATWLTDYPAA